MSPIRKDQVDPKRPYILWLRPSENPHRFEIVKAEGGMKKVKLGGLLQQQPCPECPKGVMRFVREPVDDYTPHLDALTIGFKPGVSREMPDRLSYRGHTLVSERCKDLFDKIDPTGGHLYLPAVVKDEEGNPLGCPYYYMWCGRIFASRKTKNTSGAVTDTLGQYVFYTTLATRDRCEFFLNMPIWTSGTVARGPDHLSRNVFEAIQEAGLTGFREFTHWNGMDWKDDHGSWADVVTPQNVAHIWISSRHAERMQRGDTSWFRDGLANAFRGIRTKLRKGL
jgi:hypothetical protein